MVPRKVRLTLTYIILIFWSVMVLLPIYWLFTTSFKTRGAVIGGTKYLPWAQFKPTIQPWINIIEEETLVLSLTNTAVIASISAFLALLFGTMAAYGLSRYKFHFGFFQNRDIMIWIISQRMMPPIVTAIALFIMLKWFNLLDTRIGLIMVYVAFNLPIAVWLMENFFSQIPETLEEAARIDGASRLQIFGRIVLPLAMPGLVATFFLCFVFGWNQFLFALTLTWRNARTLPVLIAAQHAQAGPQWWRISAMTVVTIVPPIIISTYVREYLVKGVVATNK